MLILSLIAMLASLMSVDLEHGVLERRMRADGATHFDKNTIKDDRQDLLNVLKMSTENLFKLLTTPEKYYNNNTSTAPGSTFFETYRTFMLPFEETGTTSDGKDAINSSVNIVDTFEQVLKLSGKINDIFPVTVVAIAIDYGFLTLDSGSIHAVQEDIYMCYAKFDRVCGFIFSDKNCLQPYIQRLIFGNRGFIIFASERLWGDRHMIDYVRKVKFCMKPIKIATLPMLYNVIHVDSSTKTYSQGWTRPNYTYGIVVSVFFSNQDKFVTTLREGKQLWEKERWMTSPSLFDMDHSWAWLRARHLTNLQLITAVATKFRTVILEVDGNNISSNLQQVFQYLSVENEKSDADSFHRRSWSKTNTLKVKIYFEMDHVNYENNIAFIDEILEAVELNDVMNAGMVDTIIIGRNQCLDENSSYDDLSDEEFVENVMSVDIITWRYVKSRIPHIKVKLPIKVGSVVPHTTSKRFFEIFDDRTADDKINLFTLQYLKILDGEDKADLIIYKMEVCLDELKINGAHSTFYKFRLQLEGILVYIAHEYNATENVAYYFEVSGCSGSSSDMEELTEYLYFYDIINKWAVNENKFVILGNAFEMVGLGENSKFCPCISNNISCLDKNCRCGLWTVKQNKQEFLVEDKKSALINYYNEKMAGRKKSSRNIDVDTSWSHLQFLSILIPVFGVCMLLSALVPWLVYRHRGRRRIFNSRQLRGFFYGSKSTAETGAHDATTSPNGQEIADSIPYNKERFEISRTSFKFAPTQPLGSGEFGVVYSGSVVQAGNIETLVAVKTVKKFLTDQRHGSIMAFKGLLSEIKVLCYIGDHENVIKIIGANTENVKKGVSYLLLEFCPNGSLLNYLRSLDEVSKTARTNNSSAEIPQSENNSSSLPSYLKSDLFRWSTEIARGMEYLTGKNVVHMDIAARNILLDATKCAKISDFGLSRRLYGYSCYIKTGAEPLPWRWMPPESLQRSLFDEKSDAWSYGVTLWEIYTLGDIPYPEMSWDVNFPLLLNGGYRPSEPKYNERDMYDLMNRCWETIPVNRPTFSEILLTLDGKACSKNIDGTSSFTMDINDVAETSV